MAAPREAIGPIGTALGRDEDLVEQQRPVRRELGEAGVLPSPARERVAAGQQLQVALARALDAIRVREGADQARPPGAAIEADHEAAAHPAGHPRDGFVVEHAELVPPVRPGVVLPAEVGARTYRKRAVLAAQAPDDPPGRPVDVVQGVRVARGDEQIAVRQLVDRVEVEVVVQLVLLGTAIGVGDRDVVERVPLEEDEAGPQVDLLQDAVPHEPVGRTADGAEVGSDQVVGVDQRRSVRGEPEVVQVLGVAVARADAHEGAVGGVVDDSLAPAEAACLLALPPGEDGLALVALHLEVVGLEIARHRVEPDQPAGRVQDHRPTLALGPLRRDEDVPGSCAGSRDVDLQRARLQVGTRVEACDAHPLRAGLLRGQRRGDRRGDREAVDDRPVGPNRHPFAVGERLGGQDARPPAVGVRPELPGVRSAPRSGDLDVVELAPRDAADRDLRARRGHLRAGRREHADPAR